MPRLPPRDLSPDAFTLLETEYDLYVIQPCIVRGIPSVRISDYRILDECDEWEWMGNSIVVSFTVLNQMLPSFDSVLNALVSRLHHFSFQLARTHDYDVHAQLEGGSVVVSIINSNGTTGERLSIWNADCRRLIPLIRSHISNIDAAMLSLAFEHNLSLA